MNEVVVRPDKTTELQWGQGSFHDMNNRTRWPILKNIILHYSSLPGFEVFQFPPPSWMLPCATCGYVNGTRQEAVRHREEHERNVVHELGTSFDTLINDEPSSIEQLDTLYQLLPLTIEDIRHLRSTWYDMAFGLNMDPLGVPPPNERPYLYYITIRGIHNLEGPARATIASTAIEEGRPRQTEVIMETDGTYVVILGFLSTHSAWWAGLSMPTWCDGHRWYTYVSATNWQ